jgi:hypothetical protein
LIAPREKRAFGPRSSPAPKLKKSKKLTSAERKYRALKSARTGGESEQLPNVLNEDLARELARKSELIAAATRQANLLGPEAPYLSFLSEHGGGAPAEKRSSLRQIRSENEQLSRLLEEQRTLIRKSKLQRVTRRRVG